MTSNREKIISSHFREVNVKNLKRRVICSKSMLNFFDNKKHTWKIGYLIKYVIIYGVVGNYFIKKKNLITPLYLQYIHRTQISINEFIEFLREKKKKKEKRKK